MKAAVLRREQTPPGSYFAEIGRGDKIPAQLIENLKESRPTDKKGIINIIVLLSVF